MSSRSGAKRLNKKLGVGIALILIIVGVSVFYLIFSGRQTIVRSKVVNTNDLTLISGPGGVTVSIPPNIVPSGATVIIKQLDLAATPELPKWAYASVSLYDFSIDQPFNGSVTIRIPLSDQDFNILGHYKNGYWEIIPFKVENSFAVVEVDELSLFSWLNFKVSWLSDKLAEFLTLRWADNKKLPISDPRIEVDENETFGLVVGSAQFIADDNLRISVQNVAPLHLDVYPVGGKVIELKRTSLFVSVESEYGMVVAPNDIGEWIVNLRPGENITFEAYFSDSAVAALFGDLIPLGRFSRALLEYVLFTRNGRKMTWGDLKGFLVIPAIAEAVEKIEDIQEVHILETGRVLFKNRLRADEQDESTITPERPQTPTETIGKIAFELEGYIHVINSNGTNEVRLTQGHYPIWSPDGKKLLYTSFFELYVINADGTSKITVAERGREYSYTWYNWSPDGEKIVFGGKRIYIVNADGSNLIKLIEEEGNVIAPTFSPDGKKIVYYQWAEGALYVINADGTGKTRLAEDAFTKGVLVTSPSWSPDSKKILYVKGYVYYSTSIVCINADGTDKITLATDAHTPVWSPDGEKIAYISKDLEGYGLYIMNADGTSKTRLTEDIMSDAPISWSPDGKKIVFNWGNIILVINADGSDQTKLAYGGSPQWSPAARARASEEPEFAREVIYIPCSEAEAILNINYEFKYFIGSNIKITIKNIGTEIIGYRVEGTPGDFEGYFIVRVSAQDPYGRNITTWYLPYEFRIGQIEHAYEKDITSLYPKEEVFRRVPIPYYPEEDNIKTYTIEVKYVSD